MQDSLPNSLENSTDDARESSALEHLSEALTASLDPTQLPSIDRGRKRTYGFAAHGIHFLLPQGLYCELLTQPAITPLPNSPKHFCGLSNVRGNLVPIYNLSALSGQLGLNTHPKLALILGSIATGAALVVDGNPSSIETEQATTLNKDDSNALFQKTDLPDVIWEAVTNTLMINNTPWHQLDPKVLFPQLSRWTH